jgi:hypothetical protein
VVLRDFVKFDPKVKKDLVKQRNNSFFQTIQAKPKESVNAMEADDEELPFMKTNNTTYFN